MHDGRWHDRHLVCQRLVFCVMQAMYSVVVTSVLECQQSGTKFLNFPMEEEITLVWYQDVFLSARQ